MAGMLHINHKPPKDIEQNTIHLTNIDTFKSYDDKPIWPIPLTPKGLAKWSQKDDAIRDLLQSSVDPMFYGLFTMSLCASQLWYLLRHYSSESEVCLPFQFCIDLLPARTTHDSTDSTQTVIPLKVSTNSVHSKSSKAKIFNDEIHSSLTTDLSHIETPEITTSTIDSCPLLATPRDSNSSSAETSLTTTSDNTHKSHACCSQSSNLTVLHHFVHVERLFDVTPNFTNATVRLSSDHLPSQSNTNDYSKSTSEESYDDDSPEVCMFSELSLLPNPTLPDENTECGITTIPEGLLSPVTDLHHPTITLTSQSCDTTDVKKSTTDDNFELVNTILKPGTPTRAVVASTPNNNVYICDVLTYVASFKLPFPLDCLPFLPNCLLKNLNLSKIWPDSLEDSFLCRLKSLNLDQWIQFFNGIDTKCCALSGLCSVSTRVVQCMKSNLDAITSNCASRTCCMYSPCPPS